MNRHSIKSTLAFASLLFLSLACSSRDNNEVLVNDDAPVAAAVSCSATPEKNAVESGKAFNATLYVSGGTAPYTTSGVSGGITTSTSISRTLSITTTYAQLLEENISVTDSTGKSGSCKLSVVVFPAGSTNIGDFSCALIPTNASPKVNEPIHFTPYVFDANQPDTLTYAMELTTGGGYPIGYSNNGFRRTEKPQLSAIYYTAIYDGANNPQARIANLRVTQNFRTATCSVPVTVRDIPSVALAASSNTVNLTDTITLTATPKSFLSTAISYSFQTNDSGLTITQSSNTATVKVNDGKFHSSRITVTASAGGESAQAGVDLNFKLTNFSCQVSAPASSSVLMINQDISIGVTSSAGNVEVYNVQPGYYGALQSGSAAPIRVQYTNGGSKTVSFHAKDAASGTPCNNGSAMSVTFTVREPLRCETALLAGSSNVGDDLDITGRAATNTGSSTANIRIHSITADRSGFVVLSSPDSLIWKGRFNEAAYYNVTVTLKDNGDNGRTAECPRIGHNATIVIPSCTVAFVDPTLAIPDAQKPVVIAARAHNPLRLRVHAANSSLKSVSYGAPVAAGATEAVFRYTQNHASLVTATVTVKNEQNGLERTCDAQITVRPALACTLDRPFNTVMTTNHWYHKGAYETAPYYAPFPVNAGYYNGGVGHGAAIAEVRMDAVNELAYPGYAIDYRMDSGNGSGLRQIVSPSSQVTYRPGYHVNGVYPQVARIFDPYDPATADLGNSCALTDADKRYVGSRLVVNTAQVIKFEMPSNAHYITECRLHVRNRGNRVNAIWYFDAFKPDPLATHRGDLHNIPVHNGSERVDQLPSIEMPRSGRMCGISVKALGNHLYASQLHNTNLPDGQNPLELYVRVTYRRYGSYYTAYYQLNHL